MIDPARIQADIDAVAVCTATPGGGATRPTFSSAWAAARAYVAERAGAAGCETRVDAAGNLHARPAGLGWDTPAWLVGSHVDSVPHGGDYDGVVGVVLALELLRSAADDGVTGLPVELVDFAEEEGPTFGVGMLGSRAWVGDVGAAALGELRNAEGQAYPEAGRLHGVDVSRLDADRIDPSRHLGFIECHIEQSPGMWRRDERLAVVRAVAGRRQYAVTVTGEANHAGATSMGDRRDALAAAATMVHELTAFAAKLSPEAVITVGRLDVKPNAVNVIAGEVKFTIDFRAPLDETLGAGDERIGRTLSGVADVRGVEVGVRVTESIPARPLDVHLVEALRHAAGGVPVTVSGALHDAAVLAPHVPTAMLFIPSRGGISHNPAEFSRVEDVATAARAVERLVRRPTIDRLNAMDRAAFVATVGHAFEHSPWVAEGAWGRLPFDTLDGLLEAMCAVLDDAADDERLALLRAHPDLVGRLATSGALTAESTAEQRAAGLDDVTEDEAAAFDRYNAAYRERFGFPFIICAREHRKAAILDAMPRRLENGPEAERQAALGEVIKIARLRLKDAVWTGTTA